MDADCDRSNTHTPAEPQPTTERNQTPGFTPRVINYRCLDFLTLRYLRSSSTVSRSEAPSVPVHSAVSKVRPDRQRRRHDAAEVKKGTLYHAMR